MKIETIRVPVVPAVDSIYGRPVFTDRAVVFDHNHKEKESQHFNSADREEREELPEEPAQEEQKTSHLNVVA